MASRRPRVRIPSAPYGRPEVARLPGARWPQDQGAGLRAEVLVPLAAAPTATRGSGGWPRTVRRGRGRPRSCAAGCTFWWVEPRVFDGPSGEVEVRPL